MEEVIRLYEIDEVEKNLKECRSEIVAHVVHEKKLRVAELREWSQTQEFLTLAVRVHEAAGNCVEFQNLARSGINSADDARAARKWHDENPGRWPEGGTNAE
jgi:hypothetical protein